MNGVLKDKKAFAVFLLPGLLFYLFSVFYPIVDSIRLSTMKWNGIGAPEFIGLGNYTKLFGDKVFYQAFLNNLIYLVIVVLMQLTIGFVFAVLLTYMKKGVSLVKTPVHYHHGGSDTAVPKYLFYTAAGIVKWGAGSCWAWKSGYFLAEQHKNGIGLCLYSGGMALYRNVHGDFLCGIDLT